MDFGSFTKYSGPGSRPSSIPAFGSSSSNHPSPHNTNPFQRSIPAAPFSAPLPQTPPVPQRFAVSPILSSEIIKPTNQILPEKYQTTTPVITYITAHYAENNLSIKNSKFLVFEGNRSPSLPSNDYSYSKNFSSSIANSGRSVTGTDKKILNESVETTSMIKPKSSALRKNFYTQDLSASPEYMRQDISPPQVDFRKKSPVHDTGVPPHQRVPAVVSYSDLYDDDIASAPKTTAGRSTPPLLQGSSVAPTTRVDSGRFGGSPQEFGSQRNYLAISSRSPLYHPNSSTEKFSDANDGRTSPSKSLHFNPPKRARSPPLQPSNASLDVAPAQADEEREMQAKAKRLARFNVELSQPLLKHQDLLRHKSSEKKHNGAMVDKHSANDASEDIRDLASGVIFSECEGLESTDAVIGLCPDMCPESEREERERKGDLDKFERLNGERNQTNKYLAVKKYNRTAERDADLIRPMPVLQKTVDYLLDILDHPYSENFLGIYNFLWDRMRAIRMELRMQHIFNQDAITMLEQMIRLHIIAMHELCEYSKGEGFSEGFDAHLNIEQMNKTSIELFQIYSDHRKKGKNIRTEKEFRGYYALLKLDRHPGYKVDPGELSLDLANMAPEIRCSPEILFARDVARACRVGNFIAFFRLARKATYLQACLMHAHFAKIRTQALASLHSSLQNNQGIPVQQIIRWLGMEGENIESLLEYHGFMLKNYEEIYMVKVGPFLNSDIDFPTKAAELVHQKKSRRIIDDVYSGDTISFPCNERAIALNLDNMVDQQATPSVETLPASMDEEMLEYSIKHIPGSVNQQAVQGSSPATPNSKSEHQTMEASLKEANCEPVDDFVNDILQAEDGLLVESDVLMPREEITRSKLDTSMIQAGPPGKLDSHYLETLEHEIALGRDVDKETSVLSNCGKDKISNENLRKILSKWKQRASTKRVIQEQKLFLASAALSSLSLGPPISQIGSNHPQHATPDLNIDYAARERHQRQWKSWLRLNVSEMVGTILHARNPDAKCICWKLVVCVQKDDTKNHTYDLASKWLLSKLGCTEAQYDDDELIVSPSHFSVWKKWVSAQSSTQQACCLSVIREVISEDNKTSLEDDITAGLSSIIFLVSEAIPWDSQRNRLQSLLRSLPSGSNLPILIVSIDALKGNATDSSLMVIKKLGIQDADKTRISSSSVVFLSDYSMLEQQNHFFEDHQLKEGLQWLAEHSPLQPGLSLGNVRALVLNYLRCMLEVLENIDAAQVGPEHCIFVFNEALNRTAEEILAAASINPTHWPGAEINVLQKSSSEGIAARMFLPCVGWNSAARVQSLINALRNCRLPSFPTDILELKQGCHFPQQLQSCKLALQECLLSYLTQSSHLLTRDLAATEANIMIQRGASIELHGSSYYIIPRWVRIFWRIYNWQLTKLASLPDAYILDRPARTDLLGPIFASIPGSKETAKRLSFQVHQSLHSVLAEPTFDEMVGVASITLPTEQPRSSCSLAALYKNMVGKHVPDTGPREERRGDIRENNCVSPPEQISEQDVAPPAAKAPDKLAALLQQCHQLQDMIDKKLAIYF